MPGSLPETLASALDDGHIHEAAPGERLAAVLAPLMLDGEASMLFTRRHRDLDRHPGEVSFPGGFAEEADGGDLSVTALRETHEEIGIEPSLVRIIGALPPVHTHVSSTLVVPFVGIIEERPEIRANADEVAEVFEVSVGRLLEVERTMELQKGGERFTTHAFDVGDNLIWGATGRMLHEFLKIWRRSFP
jgi:8-oxo-dGTP pyrophosphatase MutT (NUDIX family)